MLSSNYSLVRQAIIDKAQVIAVYKGHRREMSPHVIGRKGTREQALFCQFGGTSESAGLVTADSPKWRCVFIDELSDVSVRSGQWYTIDMHSQAQTCVDLVDVEIDWATP